MSKNGMVNVRMVITEEKILSNIDKVHRMINPKSKKQIIQLEDDSYFKDLIDSIRSYLIEYPTKKNFPINVYRSAHELVEYATNQFEDNTKQIEELIRQREKNISLAGILRDALNSVENKAENWNEKVNLASGDFSEDIIDTLSLIARAKATESENYKAALKLINARISNLESNLHIEIDMERIEDRSKALSYIGIEIADALKSIPTPHELPVQKVVEEKAEEPIVATQVRTIKKAKTEKVKSPIVEKVAAIVEEPIAPVETNNEEINDIEAQQYFEETRMEYKPSLFQRIKNCKVVRAIKYVFKIRVVLEFPALPEGRGENV